MKAGSTPLLFAAQYSESPAVVGALMNAKANLEATTAVRHLAYNRCAPYVFIDHVCVCRSVARLLW